MNPTQVLHFKSATEKVRQSTKHGLERPWQLQTDDVEGSIMFSIEDDFIVIEPLNCTLL